MRTMNLLVLKYVCPAMLEISWNRMDWNMVGNENVEQLIWDLPRVLYLNWHLSMYKVFGV